MSSNARIKPEERAQEVLSSDGSLMFGPGPKSVPPVAGGNTTAASDPAPAREGEHDAAGFGGTWQQSPIDRNCTARMAEPEHG